MALKKTGRRFKLGDWVKVRHYQGGPGRIVELRGPLGPGGAQVYRVRVGRKTKPVSIELIEDQLAPLPAAE